MSLQMLWGFLAAHPAKLINLLALLITWPLAGCCCTAPGVARR